MIARPCFYMLHYIKQYSNKYFVYFLLTKLIDEADLPTFAVTY